MRWTVKPTRHLQQGDTRVIRSFLWLPDCVRHSNEYRWWEWAYIQQEWDSFSGQWVNIRWLESDKEEIDIR